MLMVSLNNSTRPASNRRGVAMLLVIISLAMATILATAYLASRDNSAAIGNNVVESAQARWASEVGLEYGEAILQTETDWRNGHIDGLMIDDLVIGEALVDVEFMDASTKSPPTADTSLVQMQSIATVDGISQASSAYVHVAPSPTSSPVSVDLGEFAIFTQNEIKVLNNAVIAVWPAAPGSGMSNRIALGTKNVSAGGIEISGSSMAMDTTVYHSPGASQYLLSQTSGPFVELVELPDSVPLPNAPSIPVPATSSMGSLEPSGPIAIGDTRTYDFVDINGQVVTLSGDLTLHAKKLLSIWNGGGIEIAGNVTLISDRMFDINDGFIEVLPGGQLTIFTRANLYLNNAYIGDARADRSIMPTVDDALYMNPKSIRVFNDNSFAHWHFYGDTVMKGSLYGPNGCIETHDNSMIFGRVAADHINLNDSSGLFYDPSLKSGIGFTNLNSRLYAADGTIAGTSFWTLPSLDVADIAAAAASESIPAASFDTIAGEVVATDYNSTNGVPTPRVVPVEVSVDNIGLEVEDWEGRSAESVARALLSERATQLGDLIMGMPVTSFLGFDPVVRELNQQMMAAEAYSASNRIDAQNILLAKAELSLLRSYIDGSPLPPDLMLGSPNRDLILNAVDSLIADLPAG